MSWTITEQAKTSETQYFTASYSTGIVVPDNQTMDSEKINVAGYTAGTISFSISPAPVGTGLAPDINALGPSVTGPGIIGADATTTVSGLSQSSTSGSGSGAVFTLVTDVGGNINTGDGSVTATISGSGYVVGEVITFTNADLITAGLGLGTTNNLVITLVGNDLAPWVAGSTLEMTILGTIDTNSFIAVTLVISAGDLNSTFYVDWNIPLEKVALHVNNNVTTGSGSTGQTITVSGIRLITESNGGGLGYVSTSGASVGPGGSDKTIQFNDGGVFGGASGALYDKTVPQVQLAVADTPATPILSFQGDTNTGMYHIGSDTIGMATSGGETLRIANSNDETAPTLSLHNCINTGFFEPGNAIAITTDGVETCRATNQIHSHPSLNIRGFRVGKELGNPMALVRLSNPVENSWEDGHEGDSTKLWFSPSDFFPSLNAGFSNATYNVGAFDVTRGPNRGVAFGGTTSAPSLLSTAANALGPSTGAGITGATATTTVAGLSQSTTSGIGTGAVFTLVTNGAGAINSGAGAGTVTATSSGSGYVATDTITFTNADLIAAGLGPGTTGDLIITLVANDIVSTALCAMKIVPKGFQIAEGEAFVFTSVSNVSTPNLAAITQTELRVMGQILTPAVGISGNPPLVSLAAGALGYTTNVAAALNAGGAVVGNGLTSICIYWDPGQQLQVGAGNRVLLGAYLEMVRI